MTKIDLKGIQNSADRILAYLLITLNDVEYDWSVYIPIDEMGNISDYLDRIAPDIFTEINAKENIWQTMDKTRVQTDPITGEQISIEINKNEIVRPDIPDYYDLRKQSYPPLGDQMDAVWRGNQSTDYWETYEKIEEVKQKFPKHPWVPFTQEEKLEQEKSKLLNKLSLTRWLKEIGGIEFQGNRYHTDNTSQSKLLAAYVLSLQSDNFSINWKTATGAFITLNETQISQVAMAVRDHVQNCFNWEANLKNQILSASSLEELDVIKNQITS